MSQRESVNDGEASRRQSARRVLLVVAVLIATALVLVTTSTALARSRVSRVAPAIVSSLRPEAHVIAVRLTGINSWRIVFASLSSPSQKGSVDVATGWFGSGPVFAVTPEYGVDK